MRGEDDARQPLGGGARPRNSLLPAAGEEASLRPRSGLPMRRPWSAPASLQPPGLLGGTGQGRFAPLAERQSRSAGSPTGLEECPRGADGVVGAWHERAVGVAWKGCGVEGAWRGVAWPARGCGEAWRGRGIDGNGRGGVWHQGASQACGVGVASAWLRGCGRPWHVCRGA